MAIYSHRRLVLSLRQPLNSILRSNSPISGSPSSNLHFRNPNFRLSPFSSTSVLSKIKGSFNSSPLIYNWSFRQSFNGVRNFGSLSPELLSESEESTEPPKSGIKLPDCDMENWFVGMEPPDPDLTRDEIIDSYVKTLAEVVGSEEEARMKLYSVSTKHYYAFGCLISEELSNKLKKLPRVQWVLPDSMDIRNKTYSGEPVINGQPVPYDPKYHEVWVRNNTEALRISNKNQKKQKDPDWQSRSPSSASAQGSSSENLISSPVSQNQVVEFEGSFLSDPGGQRQNRMALEGSSLSDPGGQRQNRMALADSPNEVIHSSQIQYPSHMQVQARYMAPQRSHMQDQVKNQAPEPSHMRNHSMRWNPPPRPLPPSSPLLPPQPSASTNPDFLERTSQSPSLSNPGQRQNWMPPADSPNKAIQFQSSKIHNPSHMQGQARNQASQPSHMRTYPFPRSSPPSPPPPSSPIPPQPSASVDPNFQGWGSQINNWPPPVSHENPARDPSHMYNPSHMHNQTPRPSPTPYPYEPSRNMQNQNWETAARYQSPPQQPSMPNNQFSYNTMPPAEFPNRVFQSSQVQNPSHMQDQARQPPQPSHMQGQVPNQTSQPSHMQTHPMSWNHAPPPPPPPSAAPPVSYEIRAWDPSHMHNQPPSPTPYPNDPARNMQNQNWETAPRYQSPPQQPSMSYSQFSYNTIPPSAPASSVQYQGQSWDPTASGYQNQSPHSPVPNSFSYNNVPASSPAWGMQPHMNTNLHAGSAPTHVQQNEYSYRDVPHHPQNGGFSNGYPSQTLQQQPYQDNYSNYNDMHTPQSAQSYQNATLVPSISARSNSANAHFNGYSRNSPHHVHNGGPHIGHPPQISQPQSPNAIASTQGWNYQNTTPYMQNNISPNMPTSPGVHNHQFQGYPTHTSQNQQYQNSSRELQSPNAPASQGWNYQSTSPYMQNSVSPNTPVSPGVHNRQFQGYDTPRPMENSQYQHSIGSAAQNVNYNSGGNTSTRDFEEQDLPTGDYRYASK